MVHMNPDGRWTAATPDAAQPQPITAPYQPQYPGESSYLPQPDYGGYPAVRPTLPAPDHTHIRRVAVLVTLPVLFVAVGATLLIFHLASPARHDTAAGTSLAKNAPTKSSAQVTLDNERRHDLKAIQTKIETYFAQTGRYPLLSELNSPDWVTTNMPGLAQAVTTDAAGPRLVFASKPTLKQYAYQVYADSKQADCTAQSARCIVYVLTAVLSDGSSYTLHSATA